MPVGSLRLHQPVPQIGWFPLILSTINQKLRETDVLTRMFLQLQPPDRKFALRGCPTKPPSRQHKPSPAQDVAKTKSYLGSCIAHPESIKTGGPSQSQVILPKDFSNGHGPASNPSKFTKTRPMKTRKSPLQPEKHQTTTVSWGGPGSPKNTIFVKLVHKPPSFMVRFIYPHPKGTSYHSFNGG